VPWGNPSGSAYSTVGDLLRFADALLDNVLLGRELTAVVITGKVDIPAARAARTAYGFTDATTNGVRIVGHGGGAPGCQPASTSIPISAPWLWSWPTTTAPPRPSRARLGIS
jgi:hypothetical protein